MLLTRAHLQGRFQMTIPIFFSSLAQLINTAKLGCGGKLAGSRERVPLKQKPRVWHICAVLCHCSRSLVMSNSESRQNETRVDVTTRPSVDKKCPVVVGRGSLKSGDNRFRRGVFNDPLLKRSRVHLPYPC